MQVTGIDRHRRNELIDVATGLDRPPVPSDTNGFNSSSPVSAQYWESVLQAAGVLPADHRQDPKQSLLSELYRLADSIGTPITDDKIREYGEHPVEAYERRFGSLSAALDRVEIGDQPVDIDRESLLADIQRLDEEFIETPDTTMVRNLGKYHPCVYRAEFATVKNAHKVATTSTVTG